MLRVSRGSRTRVSSTLATRSPLGPRTHPHPAPPGRRPTATHTAAARARAVASERARPESGRSTGQLILENLRLFDRCWRVEPTSEPAECRPSTSGGRSRPVVLGARPTPLVPILQHLLLPLPPCGLAVGLGRRKLRRTAGHFPRPIDQASQLDARGLLATVAEDEAAAFDVGEPRGQRLACGGEVCRVGGVHRLLLHESTGGRSSGLESRKSSRLLEQQVAVRPHERRVVK
eukprot:scaffold5350_cov75-Phaeocystis_antarctica.AAC.2